MLKKIFVIVLIVFFTFCKKDPSLWKIDNLNGDKITILGHGGMGIHNREPMNSFESLNEAISKNSDGTEMDVSITKDSVLVLFHDRYLEEASSCSGEIKTKTWEEIEHCNYKYPLFNPSNIISVNYFFERIPDVSKHFYVFDCKVLLDDSPEHLLIFAEALVKHISKYELSSHCTIESFNVSFLEILRSKQKDLQLYLHTNEYKVGLDISHKMKLEGLSMDVDNISKEEIKDAHANNLRIALFNTQTEKQNREAIEKSPDYIQTDKLEYLWDALHQ